MKIRPLEGRIVSERERRANVRIDVAKLTVDFRNFANVPKKGFGLQIAGSIKVGLVQ